MEMKSRIVKMSIPLLAMGSVALAIYVASLAIDVDITATSGTTPDELQCGISFAITDTSPMNTSCNYTNTNSDITMEFAISENTLVSTDPLCVVELGKDVVLSMKNNGDWISVEDNPQVNLTSGVNVISLQVVGHASRCPLNGTVGLSGTIV